MDLVMILIAIGSAFMGAIFALVGVGLFAPDPQEIHDRLCRDRVIGPMASNSRFWQDLGDPDIGEFIDLDPEGYPTSMRVVPNPYTEEGPHGQVAN